MEWREHMSVNPDVCHGRACVRGTRIMVSVVRDHLSDGVSKEDILRSYPSLTEDSVQAVLACAAELSRERVVDLTA